MAAVHESVTLNTLVARDPEWRDYAVLPDEVDPAPQVAWVRKGEHDTAAAVDRIIQGLHRSGRLIELESKADLLPRSPLLAQLHRKFSGKP